MKTKFMVLNIGNLDLGSGKNRSQTKNIVYLVMLGDVL